MSIDKKKIKKIIGILAVALGVAFVGMSILARKKKASSVYEGDKDQQNPFEGKKVVLVEDDNDKENADGVKGHLEAMGDSDYKPSFYEKRVKRVFDVILSFSGLVVLSPIFAIIALAIKIEDPGPVLFTQKRVGQNKRYFKLHKFRSMKMNTPHDVPTHQLDNPEQYITKVGKFLRAHSLDELPQIWDIFNGNMSVIGPRPGLWNQDLLTAERDKYGANDVKPGLTGWAQINGRDELEIHDKAKLDGEYVKKIGLLMDLNCFLGSIHVFGKDESIVEGGIGKMKKQGRSADGYIGDDSKPNILVICQYYYPENFQITPICEQLVKDGYGVTVLTGLPNYPTGIIPEEYKKGHRDEHINGVHVIRCHEIPREKGIIKLGMNYLSYPIFACKKLLSLKEEYDLVFVYQLSPILMAIPGIKYAKKHSVPLAHYCCDLWPDSMKMYIRNENHLIYKAIMTISKKIYNAADIVICQSESFLPYLKNTHNIDAEKLKYIPAFADESYLEADFTTNNETIDFVFLGNLGIAQNLIAVLSAINLIKDIPGFKVHFVGDGTCLDEMKQYVKEHHLNDIVVFYGRRPVEEMQIYYKLADACLVSLKDDNATGLTLPSKIQGYMAAGKPIIGMISGSAKDVIEESNCGICVAANDINGLADAMRDFIEEKEKYICCGENGRTYFRKNFSKKIFMENLESAFDELIKR